MIEQSFFNSNFLGRDGFKWWIGQVADPDISGWSKATTLIEDEDCQYYRVKVRILGYHPASQESLPDEQLPFAHVLVPLTEGSGVNGIGKLHQIQGGETVLGFFMDGDDCQQPVIFSAFYRQKRHTDAELFDDNIGEYSFKPYSEPKRYPRHTHLITKKQGDTAGGVNVATGSTTTSPQPTKQPPGVTIPGQTKADAMFNASSNVTVIIPSPCDTNSSDQLQGFLNDFMKFLREVQQFNDVYLNPTFDTLVNLDDEILLLSKRLLGVISAQVDKYRNFILDEVGRVVTSAFGTVVPKSTHQITGLGVRTTIDSIYCAIEKLLGLLLDIILDVLNGLINKLFDVIQCTVDNILSQIYGAIEKFITENISPLLDALSDIVGVPLGIFNNILSQALQYAGLISSFINCDDIQCPTSTQWSASEGPKFGIPDEWFETIDRWGTRDFSDCDNGLICSSDIIFSGGGGFGALANLILSADGSVIGADVVDGGTRYVDSPFVSVVDNCGGSGAKLISVVNGGKVTDVIVQKPGKGYSKTITKIPAAITYGNVSNGGFTNENKRTVEFKVGLTRKPDYDVTLTLTSTDRTEGVVTPSLIVIKKSDWNNKFSVKVTGIDDAILDGDIGYRIKITSSSTDQNYDGKSTVVDLINVDNEVQSSINGTPVTPDTIPKFDDTSGDQDRQRGIGPISKCSYIHSIYVKNPGYNYSKNDEVFVIGCDGKVDNTAKFKMTIGPGNGVVKVDVITSSIYCGCSPTILINSDTGSGAVLLPVLRYRGDRPIGPSDIQKTKFVNCVTK